MRILLTGGTGVFGTRLVPLLRARGHEVLVLTRQADVFGGVRGDLVTGEGLDAACAGVDTVIHAASTRESAQWRAIDVAGTARIAGAARRAGVGHFVDLSIIGVDAIPYAYYSAKFDAEGQVRSSGLPYTVIRVAQFHEFVDSILAAIPRLGWGKRAVLPFPAHIQLQPIAVADAAEVLANRLELGPSRRVETLAGPEILTGRDLARQWLRARGLPGRPAPLPLRGAMIEALEDGHATSSASAWPGQTFEENVAARTAADSAPAYALAPTMPWSRRSKDAS
jgi:uncharacterized protein YbjT (DUF2867 family)